MFPIMLCLISYPRRQMARSAPEHNPIDPRSLQEHPFRVDSSKQRQRI